MPRSLIKYANSAEVYGKAEKQKNKFKLENVAIIAMYCHLRPPDAISFPT